MGWVRRSCLGVVAPQGPEAGRKYNLVLEYYDWTSSSSLRLSWSSPHQAPQVIPATQMYPGSSATLAPLLSGSLGTGGSEVLDWAGTFSLQAANR